MREWVARQFCKWGHCTACAIHDTPEGIGGKCIRCGTIHGWVTSEELRAYADRDIAALRGDWEQLGRELPCGREKASRRTVLTDPANQRTSPRLSPALRGFSAGGAGETIMGWAEEDFEKAAMAAQRKQSKIIASPAQFLRTLITIGRVCDGTMTPDAKIAAIKKIVTDAINT